MPRRWSAPRGNGEILADPGFDAVPALVEANRRLLDRSDVRIDGVPLRELRQQVRNQLQSPATGLSGPILVGGHQPEPSHPGVWVKNFALNGLARKVGGTPLHLVVDSDTVKHTAIKVPAFTLRGPESVRTESVLFDRLAGKPTFEEYSVNDSALFASFPDRLRKLTRDWPFEPLAFEAWSKLDAGGLIADQFTRARKFYERAWGCVNRELNVSTIVDIESFRRFASHIAADLPRFRACYNGAILAYRKTNRIRSHTHPAPELEPNEAPFWGPNRSRLFVRPGEPLPPSIRPRALTLTLFARLILGDFFIHGIGGGKYDEVTDVIIRDYFGIEPPAYQVVSATLHLPLPGFPATEADVQQARRLLRDLQWNPQRHVVPPSLDDPQVLRLVADRIALASDEPPAADHAARREWFAKLRGLNEQLQHHVWKQVPPAKAKLARVEAEARANAVLRRRDYSWLLYPEATLRPFLQRFLDV